MLENEDVFYCYSFPSTCIAHFIKLSPKSHNDVSLYNFTTFVMNKEDCIQLEINRDGWFVLDLSIIKQGISLKLIKLIYIKQLPNIKCNDVIMSNETFHNLFNNFNADDEKFKESVSLKIKLRREKLSKEFIPNVATKATIAIINQNNMVETKYVNLSLRNFFQEPCYLCNGDVFAVDISKYVPELFFDFGNQNIKFIYFKVVDIEGSLYDLDDLKNVHCGFTIDKMTTLYQTSSLQDFIPQQKYLFTRIVSNVESNDIKTLYPKIFPQSFFPKFEVLKSWFYRFTKKECKDLNLCPFFLLHGPRGVGKTLLLTSLCSYIGIKYIKFSCNNCEGLGPGQGEGKIKALFAQIKEHTPCILHLENVEALCFDADWEEDVRTLSCLQSQLQMMKFELPMVIIATTSKLNSVKPTLVQQFLQMLQLNAPDKDQRYDILKWVFHSSNHEINLELLNEIASQTAGFLYSDLSELVGLAFREKIKRLKTIEKEACEPTTEFVIDDFTTVIRLKQSAFSESIGAPKIPNVKWEDVGGLADLKEEIMCSIQSSQWNTDIKRSGLLLHGPPGTGKTLLAKAIATECRRNFLSVKGPELLNMYVGQSEENIRKVFEVARSASPCIIFFDELDSLAPNRGRSGDSGGVMDRVVSQLLAEMDGLSTSGDVFILAATNRPDLIDPAIRRPGRMDKLLYVGPCTDRLSQLNVFKALTRKFQLDPSVDLSSIANLIPKSVTGAEIYAICSSAWVNAARKVIHTIEEEKTTSVSLNRKRSVIVHQDDFMKAVTM